ncbi:hypothetical protein HanIR_Chr14g0699891 [Helianthus annuus]|nr:hypothetical protein HanIR_Chr14g0699891 [Helianthus annuus]
MLINTTLNNSRKNLYYKKMKLSVAYSCVKKLMMCFDKHNITTLHFKRLVSPLPR